MTNAGQDTKSRLLATAAELLWERSFYATGVDDICRNAGVKRGSLYHFFPSKTDLAIEAIRANWARVREHFFEPIFREHRTGMAQLSAVAAGVDALQRGEHERLGVYLGCPFGGVGQEMAHQDERLRATVDEVFDGHAGYFKKALEAAVEDGDASPGDLDARARRIFAFFEGALLLAKVGNAPSRFTHTVRAIPLLAAQDPD